MTDKRLSPEMLAATIDCVLECTNDEYGENTEASSHVFELRDHIAAIEAELAEAAAEAQEANKFSRLYAIERDQARAELAEARKLVRDWKDASKVACDELDQARALAKRYRALLREAFVEIDPMRTGLVERIAEALIEEEA